MLVGASSALGAGRYNASLRSNELPLGEEQDETVESVIEEMICKFNLSLALRFEENLAILVKPSVPQQVFHKRE